MIENIQALLQQRILESDRQLRFENVTELDKMSYILS